MINIDYIFFIKKTRFKLDLKEIKQNLSEYERRKVAPTLENHTGSW